MTTKLLWIRKAGNILSPLRNRNYSLLFSGHLVSNIGDIFYAVALPWFMLGGGGGAQALGIVLTAYGVPRVGSVLVGGALADRLGQRRMMLLSDVVRTLTMAMLAALVAEGHPALWLLCTVSAIQGMFAGLFIPAAWSITPAVLDDEDLQAGNALTTSSTQAAGIVGAGIAGAVVNWLQPAGALALDALTFVVSAVTLALMRDKQKLADKAVGAQAVDASVEEGEQAAERPQAPMTFWQLLRTSRFLQIMLVMIIFMNLGNGGTLEVALPAFVHDYLRAGASGYGIILAGFAVGALIGALGAGGIGKVPHPGVSGLAFFIVQACAMTLVPFLPNVGAAALAMVAAGVVNSLGNIIFITVTQQILPRHLLGRIMSAFAFGNYGLYPLSVALGGVVVAHYGPIPAFLVSGALLAGPCIFGVFMRDFREL